MRACQVKTGAEKPVAPWRQALHQSLAAWQTCLLSAPGNAGTFCWTSAVLLVLVQLRLPGAQQVKGHNCIQLMRRHTLLDECRILLVHGLLHLLGYDHEAGAEEAASMERAERLILSRLGWQVRSALSPRMSF